VLRHAGLNQHPKHKERFTDEDLLSEFHRVASELGRIPSWAMFATRASVSADVVRRRFGGLQGTLRRYSDWLSTNAPDSPIRDKIRIQSKHEVPPPPDLYTPAVSSPVTTWSKLEGVQYGAPIDFRGLRHAPINEQGVVYLFGMVSYELGFLVEAIHTAYPDCEAKRCVDRHANRWQRVRIEFEYRSSNFRDHAHDASQCDVIVCWEHDWSECPLEVVELRTVLNQLEG